MALWRELAVLLLDVQRDFVAGMHGDKEQVLERIERLCMFADMTEIPVIATVERPVDKKGGVAERIQAVFPEGVQIFEKSTFSGYRDTAIREALEKLGRKHLAVAGAETDVCVLQSVLDLLDAGYSVSVVEDCVFSSEPDPGPALRRMEAAGATPTTFKTLAYEVTGTVDRAQWQPRWRENEHLFPPPEEAR